MRNGPPGASRARIRLLRLLPSALRVVALGGTEAPSARQRLRARLFRSEVEAIHRDLGHDYDGDVILADHEGSMA